MTQPTPGSPSSVPQVNLHQHSEHSFLDGYASVEAIAKRVREVGSDAVAITDHNEVNGHLAFQKACRAEGVHPILGIEADWVTDMEQTRQLKYPSNRSHICLLAENNVGLTNLWALSSVAYTPKYHYHKPLMTPALMREYSGGILASDGCFAGTEEYLTEAGTRTFRETVGTIQRVLGVDGWTDAEIRSFGRQEIYELTLSRGRATKTILTTKNHRWFVVRRKYVSTNTFREVLTADLVSGDRLRSKHANRGRWRTEVSPAGVQAGIVFGDGTVDVGGTGRRTAKVTLYGDKNAVLLKWFPLDKTSARSRRADHGVDEITVRNLPGFFKDAPDLRDSSRGYLYGWLAGYFAADGCVTKAGAAVLSSAQRGDLQVAQDVCQILGIRTGQIAERARTVILPRGAVRDSVLYNLSIRMRDLGDDFFLVEQHRRRAQEAHARQEKPWQDWKVVSVVATGREDEVFCAVVPKGNAFTLQDNIFTGNCLITQFSRYIEAGDDAAARQQLGILHDIYQDNFYMELHTWQFMEADTAEKRRLNALMSEVNRAKVQFADEMGVPLVVVNDAHHARPEDWENKELVWNFNTRKNPDQAVEDYGQKADHLMGAEELYFWMDRHGVSRSTVDEAIKNAYAIAQRCTAEIRPTLTMPRLSDSDTDDVRRLVDHCEEGFRNLVPPERAEEYWARMEEELRLIVDRRFAGYFLIVRDYVMAAKTGAWSEYVSGTGRTPMLVGPSRGSAGGCLVSYLLGITTIDPIRYGLLFSRFLNVNRKGYPDIDCDFPQSLRPGVKDYLAERYGHDHVCAIGTLTRSQPKAILRDLGRAMKIPMGDIIAMSKIIEGVKDLDSDDDASWVEVVERKGGVLAPWARKYPVLFEKISEMSGIVRQSGVHPAGVVVSNQPLRGAIPTRIKNGVVVTAFDMGECEAMGAVKLDLLGLRHLDTLMTARDLVYERKEVWLDYNGVGGHPAARTLGPAEYSDPEIWTQIDQGLTAGIFQLETPELTRMSMDMCPRNEEDVAALLSIVRPGVKDAHLDQVFLDRRRGEVPVHYEHPAMEEITGDTYGVLVYQESLMQAARTLAGFTADEADDLRKMLGKKKADEIAGWEEKFRSGCLGNPQFRSYFATDEAARKVIAQVWASISAAGRYAFNRCAAGHVSVRLAASGSRSNGQMTVADMYRRITDASRLEGRPCWYGCPYTGYRGQCQTCRVWRQKFRDPRRGLFAWSLGDDGRLHPNRIVDVHYNGFRPVWKVTLEDGSSITATDNHRHMTVNGWREVRELSEGDELLVCGEYEQQSWEPDRVRTTVGGRQKKSLAVGAAYAGRPGNFINGGFSDLREWTETQVWECSEPGCGRSKDAGDRIERAHLDGDRTNNNPSNLAMMCASHHKRHDYRVNARRRRGEKGYPAIPCRIVSIEYAGEEDVYDLEMADPYHSWVGNGVVTHNSHAIGYAVLSCWEVWTKHYYPEEYIVALLATDPDNVNRYLRDARRRGIRVLPPDINLSERRFTLDPQGGAIRYGLDTIRGVGAAAVNAILRRRPFTGIADFLDRVDTRACGKTQVEALIKIGAFDSLSPDRTRLMTTYHDRRILDKVAPAKLAKMTAPERVDHVRAWREKNADKPSFLKDFAVPDFTDEAVVYAIEQELVGNYVTIDPMMKYLDALEGVGAVRSRAEMEEVPPGENFIIGGQLSKIRVHTIQKPGRYRGRQMAFLSVMWNEDEFEMTAFPDVWASVKLIVSEGSPVACHVVRDERGANLKSLNRLDILWQEATT